MKIIFFCLFTLCIITAGKAQADYTGNYHFQEKVIYDKDSEIKPGKDDEGRTGDLTILKIDSVQYKFWLTASKGWPSYNVSEISGIVSIKNNKASYSIMQEYSESLCKINFTFNKNYVEVEQLSSDSDCGFGMGVYADGKYSKKNSSRLTNKNLGDMYSTYSKYKIQADKAFLYEDGKGSVIKKQYFIKADIVYAVSETSGFIYTEFITVSGKFIYGWLKKDGLKKVN